MASKDKGYTVPDDYENLDELAGPPPDENPHEQRLYRRNTLEGFREKSRDGRCQIHDNLERHQTRASQRKREKNEGEDANLTELAVPPPIDQDEGPSSSTNDSSPASPHQSGLQETKKGSPSPGRQRASKFTTQLYTISYLILFSILGTLARLGLQALTFYPGAPVATSVLWANFSGSLIMGFLSEDRKLFREEWGPSISSNINSQLSKVSSKRQDEELGDSNRSQRKAHSAIKKTIPLYIGLTTGFCGSFTSFSSFIRDVFLALSNSLPTPTSPSTPLPRNGGYSFLALLSLILLTTSLCLSALQLGAHLALALEPYTPTFPFRLTRKILDPAVVFLAWGSWLAAILLTIWPPDRPGASVGHNTTSRQQERWRGQVLFALVFAPLGCLLRFYASLHLNSRLPSFPLGTFAVNILGTAFLGMFYDLQHLSLSSSSSSSPASSSSSPTPATAHLTCQILQGATDGFCGCLTTVSTWVLELKGLRRRHAYVYGGVSVGAGLAVLVLVVGSLEWSKGKGFVEGGCVV
ncbi:hypothetical protein MMC24_007838 [Lignoscripta atroalba]|nr:hypothetical protein [Lignoscripta atroalba]